MKPMDQLTKQTLLAQVGGEEILRGPLDRFHGLEKHGHMDARVMHAHVPMSAGDAGGRLAFMNPAIAEMRLSGPPGTIITGRGKPDGRNTQPQTMGQKP
jgi:hypothetical protein